MMEWDIVRFNDLDTYTLYALLQLRVDVFVVEQNCVYQDIDGKDKKSTHLMAWHNDNLVAYTRLVPPGVSFKEASIGRVITSPFYRGLGIPIFLSSDFTTIWQRIQTIFFMNSFKCPYYD